MLTRIRQFWEENERYIVLFLAFILISAISFEAGLLKGREIEKKPLVIEKIANLAEEGQKPAENASQGLNSGSEASLTSNIVNAQGQNSQPQNCAFVGSKNSNKYHLPTCRWAKNIKPENVVCFSSADDAAQKGYQPDKNCIK